MALAQDPEFKKLIINFLKFARINDHSIGLLTDETGMQMHATAFTDSSVDPINNYETYEFIGDSIVNACAASYLLRRFPKVTVVDFFSKTKARLVSQSELALAADRLNFSQFIRCTPEGYATFKGGRDAVLENVFEALIGTINLYSDMVFNQIGVGYTISYGIIATILDEVQMGTTRADVVDGRTRLKELYNKLRWSLGEPRKIKGELKISNDPPYYTVKNFRDGAEVFTVETALRFPKPGTSWPELFEGRGYSDIRRFGSSTATTEARAREEASQKTLKFLIEHGLDESKYAKVMNYLKPLPLP